MGQLQRPHESLSFGVSWVDRERLTQDLARLLAATRHMVGHAERQQNIYAIYAQATRVFELSDRFRKRAA